MPKITSRHHTLAFLVPGFSLIELIIVILIASLFAALVFNNVMFDSKKTEKVGIQRLKEAATQYPGDAQLVCIDECQHCTIAHGNKANEIESRLRPLTAYILDDSNNAQEIDFGRAEDKKICLRFRYYANGSTSQMILESGDRFYFIPSYFGEVEIFDDLEGAVERWRRYRDQLDSMGGFF
jgi:prepilin-type N-terminal cleavage/methylation domain-containing protein